MPEEAPRPRRFTRAELESFRDAVVPDLLPGADDPAAVPVRLLFVGINPGLWTAATQTHFAHPANRFYPALHRAGIIEQAIDPAAGMTDEDRAHLLARGIGITNIVPRATARADELSREELRAGADRLRDVVSRHRPTVVAVLGVTAYRQAFGDRTARTGEQRHRPDGWAPETRLFVLPNPSGLNAHETVATLGAAYREAGIAAGIVPAGG